MTEESSQDPSDDGLSMSANGSAYTLTEQREGVPLSYIGQKLGNAIEELHRFARNNPAQQDGLVPAMYYLLVAHLGLHNMLGAANDRTLPERLLSSTREELDGWLRLIDREGDVKGLAGL